MVNNIPIPQPGQEIDWQAIEASSLQPEIKKMAQTPQNPYWHGEGDVWTHTKLVCQALIELESWQRQTDELRDILFWAALLHDVGKPSTTALGDDAQLHSKTHNRVGAKMARNILWRDFDLSGTNDRIQFRETICSLIRFHSAPPHIVDVDNPVYSVVRISTDGLEIPKFNNRLLSILVEADMRGRKADNIKPSLEKVEMFVDFAEENDCLDNPYPFANNYSRFRYFYDKLNYPGINLYDSTWGEVIVLSALPGTGKNEYCNRVLSDLPMVSIDDVREDLNGDPTDNQGAFVNEARDRAKVFLRQKTPFVWNATNISTFTRKPIIDLIANYGASIKIVYLETDWKEQLRRNANREKSVPVNVIERLLEKMEMPSSREAEKVEWIAWN